MLKNDVILECRRLGIVWFQQDGASSHFAKDVRARLNDQFGACWIGRGGPTPWPSRSPDLSAPDYWLWGHLRARCCETPRPETQEAIKERITVLIREFEADGIHVRAMAGLKRRMGELIEQNGGQLRHRGH